MWGVYAGIHGRKIQWMCDIVAYQCVCGAGCTFLSVVLFT